MKFGKYVDVHNRFHAGLLEPCDSTCFISIWSLSALAKAQYMDEDLPNLDGDWKATLKIEFDDVTEPKFGMELTLFDEEMANRVLDFIEEHDGRPFVIHCDAGISRSVAVASFMRDAYEYEPTFHEIGSDQFRNVLVYNQLRRAWMARNPDASLGYPY